jgi:carbamate kinase
VKEGKTVVEDSGRGYRQVVASPLPRSIVQQGVLATLTTYGNAVVIAAGGGGIPVVTNEKGELEGVEAVIDKDETASLLARKMNADLLVICTDVPCAMINFRDPANRKEIHETTFAEMSQYVKDGHFAAGSMLPKVLASLRFAETGKTAVITDLKSVGECMKFTHGTIIRP